MRIFKKFWWVFAIIAAFLPKLVDLAFSTYLCNLTVMNHVTAGDALTYISTLVSISLAIFAAYLAIAQYNLLNRTFIIPTNFSSYYYACDTFQPTFLFENGDLKRENFLLVDKESPLSTKIKNIGKGTAASFRINFDYNKGKEFYDLMEKLGHKDYQGLRSNFEPEIYEDCGIFIAEEEKTWVLPPIVKSMVSHLCDAQYYNQKSKEINTAMLNNILIRQKHKLAQIKIKAQDIMDTTESSNSFVYDMFIEIDSSMSPFTENNLYSIVRLTFNKVG